MSPGYDKRALWPVPALFFYLDRNILIDQFALHIRKHCRQSPGIWHHIPFQREDIHTTRNQLDLDAEQ